MVEAKNSDVNILILDESGDFKILRNDTLLPYQGGLKPLVSSGEKPMPRARAAEQTPASSANIGAAASNLPIDTGLEEKMLQPPPPMVRSSKAVFYFHPLDEEEVGKLALASAPTPAKKYSLSKIVQKIVDNYSLSLKAEARKKLNSAVFSYLRDRRTNIETLAQLKDKNFGLILDEKIAQNLLDFLTEIKGKIGDALGLVVDEEAVNESIFKTEQSLPGGEKPIPKATPLVPEAKRPGDVSLPIALARAEAAEMPAETAKTVQEIKPGSAAAMPKPSPVSAFKFTRPITSTLGKMTDVKAGYKLYGPVEELATLNLATFRRLGRTPVEMTQKIIHKINVLSKDSLVRRSAGIKAWKQSQLYQMYLAVGQASMEHELGAEQAIMEYQKAGNEIISMAEFEAITDLNRQLRF